MLRLVRKPESDPISYFLKIPQAFSATISGIYARFCGFRFRVTR